ncbi:MAG: hypothetical protein OSA97_20720 [Nevskia sp.]|nr:hypothetical protein [Nevskia sp.]
MDSITAVAFELAAPVARQHAAGPAEGGGAPAVFDVAHFNAAYAAASQAQPAQAPAHVSSSEQNGFRSVMATLQNLNGHAETMQADALRLEGRQSELKPGEMLLMTMKAHEFLFHCELTSNVANRTSEGVQQLFREQS